MNFSVVVRLGLNTATAHPSIHNLVFDNSSQLFRRNDFHLIKSLNARVSC